MHLTLTYSRVLNIHVIINPIYIHQLVWSLIVKLFFVLFVSSTWKFDYILKKFRNAPITESQFESIFEMFCVKNMSYARMQDVSLKTWIVSMLRFCCLSIGPKLQSWRWKENCSICRMSRGIDGVGIMNMKSRFFPFLSFLCLRNRFQAMCFLKFSYINYDRDQKGMNIRTIFFFLAISALLVKTSPLSLFNLKEAEAVFLLLKTVRKTVTIGK